MSRGSHVALLVSLQPPFSLFYLFCFLSSVHQYLLLTLFLWTLKTESPLLSLPVTHSFWAVFCGMAEPCWSQGTGWCRNTNQLTESITAALNRQIIHVWLVHAETWQVDIKPDCVVMMLMCSSSSFLVVQQHNNYVCPSSSLVLSHNFSNYGSHSCESVLDIHGTTEDNSWWCDLLSNDRPTVRSRWRSFLGKLMLQTLSYSDFWPRVNLIRFEMKVSAKAKITNVSLESLSQTWQELLLNPLTSFIFQNALKFSVIFTVP